MAGFLGALTGLGGGVVLVPLLTIFFLLLAQFEVESTWRTQPKAIMATVGLVGSIIYLAWRNNSHWLIPPVLLAYVLLFVRHRYVFTSKRRRYIT